jgi:yecA family protein
VSSLARRYRNAHIGVADTGPLMPPDLRTFGAVPFGEPQRARLAAWLQEAAWPRGHMDLVELEGYLVALLVWPVGIPSGAWLPFIWGVRGWKVPNKIAARPKFEEFKALIVGFLQWLDRDLSDGRSGFKTAVLRNQNEPGRAKRLHRWGRGFMKALTLSSQGLKGRSDSAVASVRLIAATTSASAVPGSHADEEIVRAVMALMEQRATRGPLGPLEAVALPA